jgi:hypothetical protein
MTPFHHREAGLVGFALSDAALDCEIIGDLTHVAAEAIELALAARGPESLCLVSDALPGAGTGCDHFHWKGREHRVVRGAAWYRLMGDQLLAGSAMGQGEMVRKLVATGVASAAEVLTMATLAPARARARARARRADPGRACGLRRALARPRADRRDRARGAGGVAPVRGPCLRRRPITPRSGPLAITPPGGRSSLRRDGSIGTACRCSPRSSS